MTHRAAPIVGLALLLVTLGACGKKAAVVSAPPPATGPTAFPAASSGAPGPVPPPAPPAIAAEAPIRSAPLNSWDNQPLDVINGPDSPLKPVFFAYDSDELDEAAKRILTGNAEVLKTYGTWVITVEGHCDERGTAEYNLALGDRRALTAKNFLLSLGIRADRLRTVSYGKEFPFNPSHDEASWTLNRRAHFMLTSK